MAKFDLGAFAQTLRDVPNSGTSATETIMSIPLGDIHEDERNFYALTGVEELAENIQFCGLMDPLRVRKDSEGYTVVSGHRRLAALRLLAADEPSEYAAAPCIVESDDIPPALQELRLIYANSDTRRMSSADIGKQAERVEALLYELKEQGMEFPGRMRDHVAEACKVSKSKLSRLSAIRKHLAPDILAAYWEGPEAGRLNEAAAYELSQLPVSTQRQIVDAHRRDKSHDPGLKYLTAGVIGKISAALEDAAHLKCGDAPCAHLDGKRKHIVRSLIHDQWAWVRCDRLCCRDCSSFASCRDVCPQLRDEQKQMRVDAREAKRREREEKEAAERPDVDRISELWSRFTGLRRQAGLQFDDYSRAIGYPYMVASSEHEEIEAGTAKITPETKLPYGYATGLGEVKAWCAAADALGCSVDYLMGRTDVPDGPQISPVAGQQVMLAGWMPGGTSPAHECDCLVIVDISEGGTGAGSLRMMAHWWQGQFRQSEKRLADTINFPVVAWMEIPAYPQQEQEECSDD